MFVYPTQLGKSADTTVRCTDKGYFASDGDRTHPYLLRCFKAKFLELNTFLDATSSIFGRKSGVDSGQENRDHRDWSFFTRLVLLTYAFSASAAIAQSENDGLPTWHPLRTDRVAEVRKTPPSNMSESFYNRLSRAHQLLDEDNPGEALTLLSRIRPDRSVTYEAAQLHQTYGFIYTQLNLEDEAFEAFEKTLELNALPTHQHQAIAYSVAGYYAGKEQYEKSNQALLDWFRYEPNPQAEAYAVMGANYAQLDMMREALPYVSTANRLVEQPNQNWRNLQLAVHIALGQFEDAIVLLKANVGIWPNDVQTYVTLSMLYTETGEELSALAALSIPWQKGILVAQENILDLVRLNVYLNNPERGGIILSEAMQQGYVEENTKNLKLLLNTWMFAKEHKRAIETIDKLAELAEDGEVYRQKALLLNESGDWEGVVVSCRQALEKGDLESPGDVWLLQGVALTELKLFDKALDAFENAMQVGDESIQRDANAWIGYVEERDRESS